MHDSTSTPARPDTRTKQLQLVQLRLNGGTQPRASIDYDVMDSYAEAYAAGAKFPPVIVFFDGKDYWLADGFHRWWASRKAERKTILCEIHQGTQQDAQWYSYSANRTHGLHRSILDKQSAVKAALLHPNGAKMSDRQIAEYIGVSSNMVLKHRNELVATAQIAQSPDRVGRDGRTTNTANIGKRRRKTEPEPEPEPATDKLPEVEVLQRSQAVKAGNAAINALRTVYASNPYRWRAFQIVADWIIAQGYDPAADQGNGQEGTGDA